MRIGFAQVVPRHMTAPPQWIGGWVGMHLRPDRRVNTISADEQRTGRLGGRAVGMFDERADAAVGILSVTGHTAAEPDRLRPDPLHQFFMQQHVKLAAMNRVLRPVVSGQEPPGLGIDVIAVESDQRPFFCGQAHAVEIVLGEAEIVEFAHGIGLQIDADAERAHVPDRFEDNAGHADLVERQGCRQPANAAAGDDHKIIRHMQVRSAA